MKNRLVVVSALLALAPTALASVGAENLWGRRTIRGTPIDVAVESEELGALRQWEEGELHSLPIELDSSVSNCGAEVCPVPSWRDAVVWPDIPLRLEGRLLKYVDYFVSDKRGRATMAKWLKAQGRYLALIRKSLLAEHLPEALLYVAMVESGYNPTDRSRAGAQGLWQWMARAAKIYGLRVDFWVDERRNPERSTQAVVRYFHDLKERFGSWPLVLASYNAGYGAVLKAIRTYNTNDFWQLCKHENSLPWETQLYVPKVFAAAVVGANRKLFGFDEIPVDTAYAYDTVTVSRSTGFAQVAKAAGITEQQVERMNPELRRKRTPPEESWTIRLPPGTSPSFLAHARELEDRLQVAEVRQGEQVGDLAKRIGMSTKDLRTLNGIEDPLELTPGLRLLVQPGRRSVKPPVPESQIVAVPDKTIAVAGRKQVFYRVIAGDDLAQITRRFAVSLRDVVGWNVIDPQAKLMQNQILVLWITDDFHVDNIVLVDPGSVRLVTRGSDEFFDLLEKERGRVRVLHVVKSGDRWETLANQLGLSVADLERINRRSAAEPLTPGQIVVGYRSMTSDEKKHRDKVLPGGTDVTALSPPAADPELAIDHGMEALPTTGDDDSPEQEKIALRRKDVPLEAKKPE